MKHDKRIKLMINDNNIGLPLSLNRGIDNIDTEYIARMDADDIAVNNRIEKQLQYMENHKSVSLIGTNIKYIDYNGNFLYNRSSIPTKSCDIKKAMCIVNVMHHPTFFGKTSIFKKYKYRNIKYSQDYDLICRLFENNEIVENIDEYLLMYRLSQNKNTNKIVNQRISYYCIQKEYKANKLSNCNITANIQNEIKKGSINNVAKSIEKGNLSFEYLKRKKYLKFAWTFLISSICSKYQLIQNINNIKYFFIKNR